MCESSSLSLDSISPTPISCRRRFTQVRYQYLDPEYIYKHSSATSLVEYVSIPRKQESIEENEGRYAYTFVTRSPICLSLVFRGPSLYGLLTYLRRLGIQTKSRRRRLSYDLTSMSIDHWVWRSYRVSEAEYANMETMVYIHTHTLFANLCLCEGRERDRGKVKELGRRP